MSKLRVQNFGPIKEGLLENDGWIEFDKVTVFIGNQGSGKSTVAKLFSTLTWLEKAINREDKRLKKIEKVDIVYFTKFHNIHNYFKKDTFIEYVGDKYRFVYNQTDRNIIIENVRENKYTVPKLMYIPSERNFLSTIRSAFNVTGVPDNLNIFSEELKRTQKANANRNVILPIGAYEYMYDSQSEESFVIGNDYLLKLIEASSGLQSYIPMFLVSRELSSAITDDEDLLLKNLNVTQKLRMEDEIAELVVVKEGEKRSSVSIDEINKIKAKYYNKCFINIVEEPEQNLYPESQWSMLKSLLEFNNPDNNKLLMTTHSPYLINYLTLIVKAGQLYEKANSNEINEKIGKIVPQKSTIEIDKLRVYQFDEETGSIRLLENYKGMPSDENLLNSGLAESNILFSELLDIEDLCK